MNIAKDFFSNTLQWDNLPKKIEYAPKEETILLFGGLTPQKERLLQAAAKSMNQEYTYLPNPDFNSFEIGKIYGNKAQCNPTYFTVGNLIKYLLNLHKNGLSKEEIVKKYIHVTVSGCGPCRFGMYISEYKKALRDAGFEGFRVVSFDHESDIFQKASVEAVEFSPKFFIILTKTAIISDILMFLQDHLRAFEVKKGEAQKAINRCEEKIIDALIQKKSLLKTLFSCRKILEKVKLNRLEPKPKVMVMGEFWAAMTRSDGNYHIHNFLLENEAEIIAQPLINRILLNIWDAKYQTIQRQKSNAKKLFDFSAAKKVFLLTLAQKAIELTFKIYAKAIGLSWYELDNMNYLAKLAQKYYPLYSNGGEGHLEIAHIIDAALHKKANLVLSLKPFGCMPSSGISDGIASLVTSKFPQIGFLALETSGDSSVNFYSRVQMALFKAKEEAIKEFNFYKKPTKIPNYINNYRFYPKNSAITTAAKMLLHLNK